MVSSPKPQSYYSCMASAPSVCSHLSLLTSKLEGGKEWEFPSSMCVPLSIGNRDDNTAFAVILSSNYMLTVKETSSYFLQFFLARQITRQMLLFKYLDIKNLPSCLVYLNSRENLLLFHLIPLSILSVVGFNKSMA